MRKNAWRRRVATVWPEACVGGGQPLPRTTSMSMPMTQNGAQPGDGRELAALLAIGPDARARVRILVVDDEQDRKSTRLNSSHLVISYAVFCLKKKKK